MPAEWETNIVCKQREKKQSREQKLLVSIAENRYYILAEWETDILCNHFGKQILYESSEGE